jgi:hypothetical protein
MAAAGDRNKTRYLALTGRNGRASRLVSPVGHGRGGRRQRHSASDAGNLRSLPWRVGELLRYVRQNAPTVSLLAGISAALLACVMISASGMRLPGEAEMAKQIELEDSYLCEKFGMKEGTRPYWNCMLDLADLRKSHMALVASYEVP